MEKKPTPRAVALLPVAVFLVLYLVLGIILEYVLKIKMGFYQIPIVVAFLVALLVACLQNRGVSFDEKLELMGQGIGDKNIVTMLLIFLAAGIFVGAVWANVSWGRYWGWDPKEVWALVTLLVYALPLHAGSLPWFRRPLFFHWFCIAAFLSVLVTYFGVNFLLGGMHSYAG